MWLLPPAAPRPSRSPGNRRLIPRQLQTVWTTGDAMDLVITQELARAESHEGEPGATDPPLEDPRIPVLESLGSPDPQRGGNPRDSCLWFIGAIL